MKINELSIGRFASAFKNNEPKPIHQGIILNESSTAFLISNEKNKEKEPLCIEWFAKKSLIINTRIV